MKPSINHKTVLVGTVFLVIVSVAIVLLTGKSKVMVEQTQAFCEELKPLKGKDVPLDKVLTDMNVLLGKYPRADEKLIAGVNDARKLLAQAANLLAELEAHNSGYWWFLIKSFMTGWGIGTVTTGVGGIVTAITAVTAVVFEGWQHDVEGEKLKAKAEELKRESQLLNQHLDRLKLYLQEEYGIDCPLGNW